MPLHQPSPDRLIFYSEPRSNIASKVDEFIYLFIVLAIGGGSSYFLYLIGWLFGRFMSHEFAGFITNPLDNLSYLGIVFLVSLSVLTGAALCWYFLKTLNLHSIGKQTTLEIKLPSQEGDDRGEISLARKNMFDKLNIFYKSRAITIPIDRVLDIRIAYTETEPFYSIQVLLITNTSAKPVVFGDFSCYGSRSRAKKMLHLAVAEVEQIRTFLNLPTKPSYLVEGKSDLSIIFVPDYRSKQKLLTDTQNIFKFVSTLSYSRTKVWSFDLKNNCIDLESYFLKFKSHQKIEMIDIKSVIVKREAYGFDALLFSDWILLSPHASKILFNILKDRYSLVLTLKDDSSFKCPNNYLRVFSSTNLASIEEYADRLRSHLNLPERVNEERFDRTPAALT